MKPGAWTLCLTERQRLATAISGNAEIILDTCTRGETNGKKTLPFFSTLGSLLQRRTALSVVLLRSGKKRKAAPAAPPEGATAAEASQAAVSGANFCPNTSWDPNTLDKSRK